MTDESVIKTPVAQPPVIDKASAVYKEMLYAGLQRMNDAASEILKAAEDRLRRVPEPYFRFHLLPILQKWIKDDPNDPAEPGLWFNVADGMNNEMAIVDEAGELLFVAPPLYIDIPPRNQRVEPGEMLPPSIHQIVGQQGMMHDNGDHRGFLNVEYDLAENLSPRPQDAQRSRYLTMTAAVYYYYGLPLSELLGGLADVVEQEFVRQGAITMNGRPTTLPGKVIQREDDGINEDEVYVY